MCHRLISEHKEKEPEKVPDVMADSTNLGYGKNDLQKVDLVVIDSTVKHSGDVSGSNGSRMSSPL